MGYPTMGPHLGFGRKVSFIEYHLDLFTRSNFACLQDLVGGGNHATNNHLGWMVDIVMPYVCRGNMGVIDAMKMFKVERGSYPTYNLTKAGEEGHRWVSAMGW